MIKHYTIPIFIPELACPHQCVFCNQRKISGSLCAPAPVEIEDIINQYLETLPEDDCHIEIGYFGGNFTGIAFEDQESYLRIGYKYLGNGDVNGIRLSTRPDYIDHERLELLKKFGVGTIELGAQSMVEEVLIASGRGHTLSDIENASKLIIDAGFELGLQMMIGLPEDTLERSMFTAKKIAELRASNTRIYPALVIKDTQLAEQYLKKQYQPLTIEEAIRWTKKIYQIFEQAKVNVIRMGLHPSEGLLSGNDLLAGPFHPSFKELVMTEIWKDELLYLKSEEPKEGITIYIHPKQYNFAIGYEAKNKKMLQESFKEVKFKQDDQLKNRTHYVHYH